VFAWLEIILTQDVGKYGYLAVFITMALESACIPIPSEIVMPYAGYLVTQNKMTILNAAVVGSLANLFGSWIAYFVGRYGGRNFIEKYGKYVFLSYKHLAWADKWFAEKGDITVLVSRMLPAVRTFISLPAGITRMNFFRFSIYTFIGALPWNLALVYVGYVFAGNWELMQDYLHKFNYVIWGTLVLLVIAYIIYRRKKKK
jgi:membrane protein DedA with SNARE-associated domain